MWHEPSSATDGRMKQGRRAEMGEQQLRCPHDETRKAAPLRGKATTTAESPGARDLR